MSVANDLPIAAAMRKLPCLLLLALLAVPMVLSEVYVKPDDIRFRAGGVQRFNEYFYDPRVQSIKDERTVYLTPVTPPVFARGYPAYYPRGTVKITSTRSQYKPIARIVVQVKDLRPSWYDRTVYEAWLYDSETGHTLGLGKFLVEEGNNARFHYTSQHYLDAYDFVLITREKEDDMDPRPSNEEVLIGKLTQKEYYEPKPLLGERAQYGYSYYAD